MDSQIKITNLLQKIKGLNIAIVYAYKNENAKGFGHYDYWKMNVVSDWAKAVEELGCIPYLLDVRTFAFKAMNDTLPFLDFVVNLNAGNQSLSTLGLVPSICGFLSIPCIPCDTNQAVTGENKNLTNLIAKALKIRTPDTLDHSNTTGIYRPNNLGSSIGVTRGNQTVDIDGVYQEFIPGFDFTTPVMYNPLNEELSILPGVLYVPEPIDVNWFLGADEKALHKGYQKHTVAIDNITSKLYLSLARSFGIKTFCRIDARLQCTDVSKLKDVLNNVIDHESVRFLELNTMPTISEGINFCNSVENVDSNSKLGECFQKYRVVVDHPTTVGFILFCSLVSLMQDKLHN